MERKFGKGLKIHTANLWAVAGIWVSASAVFLPPPQHASSQRPDSSCSNMAATGNLPRSSLRYDFWFYSLALQGLPL